MVAENFLYAGAQNPSASLVKEVAPPVRGGGGELSVAFKQNVLHVSCVFFVKKYPIVPGMGNVFENLSKLKTGYGWLWLQKIHRQKQKDSFFEGSEIGGFIFYNKLQRWNGSAGQERNCEKMSNCSGNG